ncbi:MAG: TfoX/Sxy family protein [Cellvibrionaceae bacterium]|nr:TfoX/Sxy family protein [Cellvibrionaceae bacterium]
MFGGLAFMVGGHMCVGVRDTSIFARIGPDKCNRALEQPGTRKMDFTGRALKGFVYVSENVLTDDPSLCQWIKECESFIMSLPPK